MKKLEYYLKYEQPTRYIVESDKYNDDYDIPVLTAGKSFILGYTNEKENIFPSKKLPVIIFDDFTTDCKFVDFPFKVKSSAMKILHPINNANAKFLYYYMKQIKFDHLLHKRYWISQYSQLEIKELDKKKQNEFVKKMEDLERLINIKEKQIKECDNLIKSQFVEMFENINEEEVLSNYIDSLTAGKSLAGTTECVNKVLKTGSISGDYFDVNEVKNLPVEYKPKPEHKVNKGDVIISRMNTAELVGACGYVWKEINNIYYPDRLWKANLKNNCNAIFIWQSLIQNEFKVKIRDICSGTSGSMKNISKNNFLKLKIKKVPLELQNKFADIVEQIDKQKFVSMKVLEIIGKIPILC